MDYNVKQLPMLILRGKTLLPSVTASFDVGRIKSLTAVGKSIDYNNLMFIVSQKDATVEEPTEFDVYDVGVVVRVKKISQLGGTNLRVFVETLYRAEIREVEDKTDYFLASVVEQPDVLFDSADEKAYFEVCKEKIREYTLVNPKTSRELTDVLRTIPETDKFCNVASYHLPIKEDEKQEILDETVTFDRLKMLIKSVMRLIEFSKLEKKIAESVKESIDKSQKEYYLREQLKAVHKELGDDGNEIIELREKILAKKMPKEVEEKGLKELDRMSKMSSSSPDYTVLRTYVDALIELPFNETTKDREDINEAIEILDSEHFGLEKVKERIIEYIAVLNKTGKMSSTILCLVGPPGVGKTSVATSISHALDRKFVRMSLGGVKDEAEIRGHRKTYIGAMPGRIITGLKNVGVSNPVFLLDEIDKMSVDLRGDPASALLEVLDPEQNTTFRDRYMEIPYDLSKVLFITTANSLDTIPSPLLDRMEIIELDGYTKEEKVEIAKQYLIKKRARINGLTEKNIEFTDDSLTAIVSGYTREAGVRNLERKIDAICRKVTTEFSKLKKFGKRKITEKTLEKYLGMKRYSEDEKESENLLGTAQGLAWTQYGGTTLAVESTVTSGKGGLLLTGKLGDVMKESAQTAYTFVRTNKEKLGLSDIDFSTFDVHVHVPEGATPKDGPSAGITIATAIYSAFSKRQVKNTVAMTGEITLRGNVLPIGGLKQKALSAFRCGIYDIIIPEKNLKDIVDIDEKIRKSLNFIPVKTCFEVFENAII